MFSTLSKRMFIILSLLIFSSASALNLDYSKILLFGTELRFIFPGYGPYGLVINVILINQWKFCCFEIEKLLRINSLPNNKIKDLSKLKAFADYKINVTQIFNFVLGRIENIMGKGENAGYQHFLLFPWCFQKLSFSWSLKVGIVW